MLADALGRPLRFILTAGQKADCEQALPLLENRRPKGLLADRGYDTDSIRRHLKTNKIEAVIPARIHRREPIAHNAGIYRMRNRIERCFGKLKSWRRIATRFDRNDEYYMAFLHIAASMIWMHANVD